MEHRTVVEHNDREHLAIVTGAARGIGRAIAQRLAAEGIAVAAVSRTLRPGDGELAGSLAETVELITAAGGTAAAFAADLSRPDLDRAELIAKITAHFGRPVDILVNNAAAARHHGAGFDDVTREWFVDTFEVNVWNTWDLIKTVAPAMIEAGRGWIVNLSSRTAAPKYGPPYENHPLKGGVLYGSSKAALDRLSTGIAMELHEHGIAVNTLAPNRGVMTENAARAVPGWPSEPVEAMAEACHFLCTADPTRVTGRVDYSLALIKEFELPVRSLDGTELVEGWQPDDIDPATILPDYLVFSPPPPLPAHYSAQPQDAQPQDAQTQDAPAQSDVDSA